MTSCRWALPRKAAATGAPLGQDLGGEGGYVFGDGWRRRQSWRFDAYQMNHLRKLLIRFDDEVGDPMPAGGNQLGLQS